MADQSTTAPSVAAHGTDSLPEVEVDSYNVELKDDEGLLGDRANKGAFRAILERWRKPLRKAGDDPFGDLEKLFDDQTGTHRTPGEAPTPILTDVTVTRSNGAALAAPQSLP